MWWLFEKVSQINGTVLYAYSRGNRNLDGRISIEQKTKDITMVQPCAADVDSAYSQRAALEKTWRIIALDYPDHRQIACG
jgi:hypothetical protein